jgi:diguanylate cyclase (GGDEF)-like protein
MTSASASNLSPDGWKRLFQLWLIDAATIEILRKVRPYIKDALIGQEEDFSETFRQDSQVAPALRDDVVRGEEAAALARFWQTVFADGLDEARLQQAADLGRQHFNVGLGSGHFLLASQRVLRRLVDALIAVPVPDRAKAIDAVTRVVLLADDIALTAYFDTSAGQASQLEVDRRTEQLRQQMRVLEELAHVDGLTKLFNRRHFDQAFAAEIDRCARQRSPLCLLFADLDNFKQINDQYGHMIGDSLLAHVAKVLHETARRSDILARYGGEEFALVLPATPLDRAAIAAERLRRAIERRPMVIEGRAPLHVTISIGVAASAEGDSAEDLMRKADLALYRAKADGRNRVVA